MKLKQRPEDFIVEELTTVRPEGKGPFALYRLEKVGMGTPEAVQAVCRKWKLRLRDVSYGGLKDRHAWTTQFLTIFRGPRRHMKQSSLHLQYLGQLNEAFGPGQVSGNRFQVTLRDLSSTAIEACLSGFQEAARFGVPNYFDDQRFGSVGPNRQFIARRLIEGDYERALKLALAEPYESDSAARKEEKRLLREIWGNWASLSQKLRKGESSKVVAHLQDYPGDYRGAFALLRPDLKSLYLAAFQSYLWNKMLARWLEEQCRPDQLLTLKLQLGSVPAYRRITNEQYQQFTRVTLPLPSARLHLAADDPLRPIIDAVMREEDLELSQMKIKHLREPFFSKGDRAALFTPTEAKVQIAEDERHEDRQKVTLKFTLPRGCYATLLIKRVMAR